MKTLLDLFLSFLKIGFFSFGGTTMIPVINDEVLVHGWMTADEVMDIVAVAEMTPGSLGINCATFVGLRTAGIFRSTQRFSGGNDAVSDTLACWRLILS